MQTLPHISYKACLSRSTIERFLLSHANMDHQSPYDPPESTLSVPNLSRELVSVSDWYLLGIKLGLQPHDLRKIQESHPSGNCERWKVEVIDLWLRNSLGCSWEEVVSAIHQMGEHAVARKIQLKYIRSSPAAGIQQNKDQEISGVPKDVDFQLKEDESVAIQFQLEEKERKIADIQSQLQQKDEEIKTIHKCFEIKEQELTAKLARIEEQLKEKDRQIRELHICLEEGKANDRQINVKIDALEKLVAIVGNPVPPLDFIMTDFSKHKANNTEWYSPCFYSDHTKGYKLCVRLYTNGCVSGRRSHVSIQSYLLRGEHDDQLAWPRGIKLLVQVMNHMTGKWGRDCHLVWRWNKPKSEQEAGGISGQFIAHSELDYSDQKQTWFLKDDSLHFRIAAVEMN